MSRWLLASGFASSAKSFRFWDKNLTLGGGIVFCPPRLTIDCNARRRVNHSWSLVSPLVDSCRLSALRKCSAASLSAPMFRPLQLELSKQTSTNKNSNTYMPHQHCRWHGYRWAAVVKLPDTRLELPLVCFDLTEMNQVYSREDNPIKEVRRLFRELRIFLTFGRTFKAATKQSCARSYSEFV